MRRDVPLRRGLLLKLLVFATLVSACSIAATAWLTVRVTAVAIRQEQGQTLADDARIYNALLGWAATHHAWAGAARTVRDLARSSGHRITLTDENRRTLLDSATDTAKGAGDALPAEASATVDPLHVETALAAQTAAGGQATPVLGTGDASPRQAAPCASGIRCLSSIQPSAPGTAPAASPDPNARAVPAARNTIDARAVGPFRLTGTERKTAHGIAVRTAACLRDRLGVGTEISGTPSGRPVVRTDRIVPYLPTDCPVEALAALTPTEARALGRLGRLVDACLARRGAPPVRLNLDFGWTRTARRTAGGDLVVASCVDGARREQLAPYVAPPALLFLSSPPRTASSFLDLSANNRARIVEVTGLVLLLTLTVGALTGTRMVRPLRALAGAARRMTDGDLTARVRVGAQDEIGSVAAAFNTMAEQREQSEGLRKAMVSDVAHELRTPLSNIRGWLEAAEDGLVVPDRELLSSLLDEAVLLQHVIDDLRDLSAADAGELRLRPERLDVDTLIGQVATAHRGGADAAGVTLRTAVAGRPELTADSVRLRQAVGNLVSNAVRHTPSGGTVTLRARVDGDTVVIEVADTGTGIPAADLPRVFDRFWRAEKSRSRETGGSGLGLSIVRKLVEAHGGRVTADSTTGVGSVFTLVLPRWP